MTIHKELVNQIIKQYNTTLEDILGKEGLDILGGMQNIDELPDQFDRIFYTLEFLEKEGLVEIRKTKRGGTSNLLNLPCGNNIESIPGIIFYNDKIKNERIHNWEIEMKPGLIHFKQQGYKTDEQIKEDKQFWLVIGVAVLASFLSALFTTYFPIIF